MPSGNLYTPHLDSRDIVAGFSPAFEAAMENQWFAGISTPIPSDRETEEMAWVGQVAGLRRWAGGRHEGILNKYSLSLTNYKYEDTLRLSNDDLRRDKTGLLRKRVSDMALRAATHWNVLGGTWITNGEAGTSGLAYDGQFFFDTDHNESGSHQTNDLTATEVPAANVTTTSTLTTTEAAGIITETIAYMQSLTDDQGEPINQGPTPVTILCTKVGHYNGLKTALGLNNLGTGSGNNNPLLAWNDYPIRVQYVPTSRITAADKLYFFFGEGGMGAAPLIRAEELVPQQYLYDDTFNTASQLFGIETNRGVAYGYWQKAALVTLS